MNEEVVCLEYEFEYVQKDSRDDPTVSCHFLSKEKVQVLIHIKQTCILVVIDCLR
jgi:hypothetical protein